MIVHKSGKIWAKLLSLCRASALFGIFDVKCQDSDVGKACRAKCAGWNRKPGTW